MSNLKCICKGNWRLILSEYRHLMGRKYKSEQNGLVYEFMGILHGEDDYYYVLWSEKNTRFLSCVSDIETFGFERMKEESILNGKRI